MSDEKVTQKETADAEVKGNVVLDEALTSFSRLDTLKATADILGIGYSHLIGETKLSEKIDEFVARANTNLKTTVVSEATSKQVTKVVRKKSLAEINAEKRKKASALIRIRVTCMNPSKKTWPGETFTVSNSSCGTFKKFVPFGIDEGWHVPVIILNMMKARVFTQCYTLIKKDSKGREIKKWRSVKEFAIEVLPPLTELEIKELATKQAVANNLED